MHQNKKTNTVSLTREDLEDFANNDIGFYGLELSRISSVFIAQVMQLQGNRVINTSQMLDEVKFLEGITSTSSTKKPEAFNKLPLKGLMKKHFNDANFIIKNLDAHFGYQYGGNKRLKNMVEEAFSRNESGYVDDEFISYMAHHATIGALEERAKNHSVSGEWIVFQKHKDKNYYLTLAAHNEGDDNIFKRIKYAYELDFGFLQKNA